MAGTEALIAALKTELKRAGLTYAQLARELGLAESSVKRILSRGDMPLSRIDQILAVLKLDFADLAREVTLAAPPVKELTFEQERAVVADPRLLLAAICTQSQWSLEQILATYTLTKPQAVACLVALDKLGFIELRADNRYRLKIDKTFRWRPDGPVMRFFREHAVADYFSGGFDGPGEILRVVHGQVGRAQALHFNDRLYRLAQDFAQQHVADQRLPAEEKEAFTVVIGMRSWLFSAFREMLRQPADG